MEYLSCQVQVNQEGVAPIYRIVEIIGKETKEETEKAIRIQSSRATGNEEREIYEASSEVMEILSEETKHKLAILAREIGEIFQEFKQEVRRKKSG